MAAGEIADRFSISKPSISHHLDLLKQADLVLAEKRGQYVIYSLNTSVLDECLAWLLELKKRKEHHMKTLRQEWLQLLILAVPFCAVALLWDKLPGQMPMQWDANLHPVYYSQNSGHAAAAMQ